MTQVTIQGRQYSDDGTTARDMLNGGHRQHFFPLVQDIVTTAGEVAADEAAAAISAANAANSAAATQGTSTTSNTVGSGYKTFTTQINKQFAIGSMVTVSRTSAPSTLMHGQVTAYNSGTGSLTVNVSNFAGSGTYTDWTIALSGIAGPTGATGDGSLTYMSVTGATTLTTTDKAKFIEGNGTFTLSFQAAATLGSTWATTIKNVGTGNITLNPNGSETIDGVTTTVLYPGEMIKLHSNGTVLRSVYRSLNRLQRVPILSTESANLTGISQGESLSTTANYNDSVSGPASIASSGSIFVKGTFASVNVVESSTDGTTWVNRTMTTSGYWHPSWVGSKFLATMGVSTTVNQSNDGITWSSSTSLPGNVNYHQPVYDGSSIILVPASAANTVYRSTDSGASWTTQTSNNVTQLDYSGGLFISSPGFQGSASTYYTSSTGLTGSWTTRTLPGGRTYLHVLHDGVLICWSNTNSIMTSSDGGVNWTDTGINVPFECIYVERINNVWLFVQNSAPDYNTVTRHINNVERLSLGSMSSALNRKVKAKIGNVMVVNKRRLDLSAETTGVFSS